MILGPINKVCEIRADVGIDKFLQERFARMVGLLGHEQERGHSGKRSSRMLSTMMKMNTNGGLLILGDFG